MKSYKEVVSDRYDKQSDSDFNLKAALRWMPSQLRLTDAFFDVLKAVDQQHSLANARILEIGCGDGRWTRFIAEVTHRPSLITGTDLSAPRIELARRMNPAISYHVADAVEEPIGATYDMILAWNVFIHFPSEVMIRKALQNIHKSLSENGVFVFFDAWAHSHFEAPSDSQSWGFNPKEIIELAKSEGFTKLFRKNMFRIFPRGKHSEQYYGVVPSWLVRGCEIISPTPPGNYFLVFGRERDRE